MYYFKCFLILLVFDLRLKCSSCSLQGEEVAKWANAIGEDLWKLGREVTKITEIKQKYAFLNARVEKKDLTILLQEIKENILRMMDRKMDAIRCIQQEAEKVAETFNIDRDVQFKYYSSKWSSTEGAEPTKLPKSLKKNRHMYLTMVLNNDTHFYNLPVNTSHSSVHVPTNVYDKEEKVAEAIQWSEALDKVFAQNYKSDPALSWQYFGSSSGIMRHYPAMHWEEHKKEIKDLFDCRIRTWFIEAATCTKDVVILIDNSGSMDGMGKHIGALTAYSILDTFSNNDYVNILYYSEKTAYVVPCFEDQLVQATKENIRLFKDAINSLEPSGKTLLEPALENAFQLLSDYRTKRGCDNENSTDCNQAIMILTDGLNANYSQLVMKHNYLFNGTNIPVRIFTYLIGQEVTNVEESKWMSCANRGYYTHVQTLEQVTAAVLQYIYVVARPLVLQAEDHPVSWTHAYADLTYDDATDITINEPYRLLTSAAIPCYDMKINKQNDTRTAELLGVAATDVPIDEFQKLIRPYKIGVNAYAFIVSNNGYVLMHPDLRPVFNGILKENYNSIDLTEVEQHDHDLPDEENGKRQISETLRKLRSALVNGSEGSMHNVTLKYHYDDNKRVAEELYDYYFAPLEYTPFSIAIALPSTYGKYSLDVGDEIQKNRHTGENLTSFFKGKWKIHPKWVYCRYHYLEGHEFDTPEEELIHFLGKMYDMDFKWERQYEPMETEDINQIECGRKTLGDDDYYCDKQLVQRLIFDARNTFEPFKEKWSFQSDFERQLFEKYNVSLRFVATMSGLTRWDYIFRNETKSKTKEFGDLHPRAIHEKWYKSAVLQHKYDTDSFVYSVPFNTSPDKDDLVTASYAIFVNDVGLEAPASVVGFQFSQASFQNKVVNVSTRLSNQCSHCDKCGDKLTCYVVDSSGYIVASKDKTGQFFGEVEGDIFESMLNYSVFKEKILNDYQALCQLVEQNSSSSPTMHTPIYYISSVFKWFVLKTLYLIGKINLYQILDPLISMAQEIAENISDSEAEDGDSKDDENEVPDSEDDDDEDGESDSDDYTDDDNKYTACENKTTLYILQQSLFIDGNFLGELFTSERTYYYVKRIPNSNLIFVAIQGKTNVEGKKYTTTPQTNSSLPPLDWTFVVSDTHLPCQKLHLNSLPRRRLTGCYNEHYLEHEIKACGKASPIKDLSLNVFILSFILKYFLNYSIL
ncbi:voltage-dependent calcium channel subunit alpha-2/delta-3 [Sitophilus oryzae]|uniref:Voltage-dependent calcium channel subunit alpha-2/delta-3 n=1 Tax=Sitophilus oryzae TaxID=7048 RepID=A0A6J2XC00_SITOR|nr:voltage-dependent calcium channel subunit alpha-2/delta-3 [Sitophilus oryzae]